MVTPKQRLFAEDAEHDAAHDDGGGHEGGERLPEFAAEAFDGERIGIAGVVFADGDEVAVGHHAEAEHEAGHDACHEEAADAHAAGVIVGSRFVTLLEQSPTPSDAVRALKKALSE